MTWAPRLDDLGSSLIDLAFVLGLMLVLPAVFDRRNAIHRGLLFGVAAALALRYIWWRGAETLAPLGLTWDWAASWSFFLLEAVTLLSSLSAFVILSRHRDRRGEATENAEWWGGSPAPRVAVLIATYNESKEVLERTIIGAKALDHPAVDIYILDDGRRDWLEAFCAELGVRHMTRPDNKDAKAGNINHTLAVLREEGPPEFIAVLDADFVPHRDFLARTLALFHAPDVGLVQTPQHFFNPDPIQHNLGLDRSYPDEQRFFFDHLQPSRDAWGIAFCCGTSSVVRWRALEAIGGLPTDSVTEDFMLTLALQEAGWRTVYLNEPLTEGLAPEGLKEYVTQRARWCLGLMQIARGRLGPLTSNRLRLRDRWSVIDSVLYWTTTFSFRLAALTFPLLYWFFGVTVVNASVPDVITYFGVYFLWILMALNLVSRGLVVPIVNDVSQLLGAAPITRAALIGLARPKGHPFQVTAKGGDRTRIGGQWALRRPFLVLCALTTAAVRIGAFSDRFAFNEAGDGKIVILFWTLYNLVVLGVTILVCVELPRAERHVADRPVRALVEVEGETYNIWVSELATEAARIRGIQLEPGTIFTLTIDKIGAIEGISRAVSGDGMRAVLTSGPARDRLLERLYAEGAAPGVTRTRFTGLLTDFVRRLVRS